MRALRAAAWALLLLVCALAPLYTPTIAYAHATMTSSEPADGAASAEAPTSVRIWFSEAVSPRFSSARLFAADGRQVEIGAMHGDPAGPQNVLSFAVPELVEGSYSVLWRAFSEADGHFSQGLLVFGVGEIAQPGGALQSMEPALSPLEAALRWLNYLLLMAGVGALAALAVVVIPIQQRRIDDEPTQWRALEQHMLAWAGWLIGAAFIVGVGLLAWQGAVLLDGAPGALSPATLGLVIRQTRWGKLWLARQVMLALLSVAIMLQLSQLRAASAARRRRWPLGGALVLCIGLLLAQASIGHAAGDLHNPRLAIVVTALHLLAAAFWVGGLLAVTAGLATLVWRGRVGGSGLVKATLSAFGPPAALSVGLLAATGLYSMGIQVASLDALLTTTYGRILLGKVGVVLLAGLFGLLNTLALHPAKLLPARWFVCWQARVPGLVGAEAAAGALILAATALITATPPPRGVEFTIDPAAIPSSLSQSVDDLVVTLGVKPNRPGQNVFTVHSASTRRPPPADTLRILLRFTYLAENWAQITVEAQEVEPGRYMVTANTFRIAGPWRVDVVTRRSGVEDSVAQFDWVVAPAGDARPVVVSKQPLARPLLWAAAGILVATVLAGWILYRRKIAVEIIAPITRD